MKNILFPKYENSKRASILDLNYKPKNRKYNIYNNDYFVPKKSARSNIIKGDDSEQLSSSYNNINLMISNCLETIRAQNNEIENNNNNSFYKDINAFFKKKEKNYNFKNAYGDISKQIKNLNKSLSLSNSNLMLKSSEENILNNLNKDKTFKGSSNIFSSNLNKDKTQKGSSNIFSSNYKKAISIRSTKNRNSKVGLSISNNNSNYNNYNGSCFSPKRNNNKNKNFFFPKKKEFDLIKEKSEKKNKSSSKMPNVQLKDGKEYSNILFNYIYKNNNNGDILTPKNKKSLKSSKKSFNSKKSKSISISSIKKSIQRKAKSIDKISFKKMKLSSKYLSLKNTSNFKDIAKETIRKARISKISKNAGNSRNFFKKSFSIFTSPKNFGNKFEEPNRMNSNIKSSILQNNDSKYMKILTLKEIEDNIRNTIILFDYKELKKELDDFEKNSCTEIINKLPTKPEDNTEKFNYKINMNTKNCNMATTINNIDELLTFKTKEDLIGIAKKIQIKYRRLFISKKVYDSLDDEEWGDEEDYTYYLSPNSLYVYLIDLFVLISSFIVLFYLPFFLAYNIHKCKIDFLNINSLLFYFIDLIYVIDLIMGFFRAYYNFEEFLIKDNFHICIKYLTGWFLLDLIEAIPFYTILNLKQEKCDNNTIYNYLNNSYIYNFHYSFLILKIIKIFKTLNNNRILFRMISFLNENDFFYNWGGVFFSLLVVLSSLHFGSCYFIFLGRNVYPGWIFECNLNSYSFYHIYIASLYYIMTTLTTVGYGDIIVTTEYERIYQIILLIVGTCAYSWILTFISNYIKKQNERFIDFENKLNILGEIKLSYPQLNNELYERVLRYLYYNKSEYKYNVENILESLPSTLQNNLIVEMYKPIIRNFHFFKSFENSDFFVKIVTSLKPILTMKDDILIQEGDFIEDIIFIKKGVLTLEILIDLNSPKESAEEHLNMSLRDSINIFSDFKTMKSQKETKVNSSFTMISQNTKNTNTNLYQINSKFMTTCENKSYNKKAMKIIDLRKNEHFGDVLMILNERSPLTVKVKSKKAELFLLQKTDATEISNEYPNIWKRILHKSLYNMKQIKNIIRKKILIYCELNDININSENNKNFGEEKVTNNNKNKELINKKKSSKRNIFNPKKHIESIILEEDETFDSLCNNYALNEKKAKRPKRMSFSSKFLNFNPKSTKKKFHLSNISQNLNKVNKKQITKTSINNNKQNKLINELNKKSNNDKSESKDEKMIIEINDNKEKKTYSKNDSNSLCNINNMISIIDEKMKSSKGHINNFSINIFTPKTVQIPINHINNNISLSEPDISKNDINNEDNNTLIGTINNEIYFNENFKIKLKNKSIIMNNKDKNNDIIYPNLKRILGNEEDKKNNINNIKKLLDYNKTSDNSIDIKNQLLNNENNSNINSNLNKSNIFVNLNSSKNISFTINSTYENINQLSKYKFQNDSLLQQKTKNFIIYHCFKKPKSFEYSLDSKNKNSKQTFSPSKIKNNSLLPFKYHNRQETEESRNNRKRILSLDPGNKNLSSTLKSQKTSDVDIFRKKRTSFSFKNKKKSSCTLNKSIISKDENLFKRKRIKKGLLNSSENEIENEKNFYNRIKTYRRGTKSKEKEFSPKLKKFNLEDKISQNIEQNKQNLNNPEEYFSGFFNDILLRKKTAKNAKIKEQNKKNKSVFYKKKENTIFNSASKNRKISELTRFTKYKRNSTANDDINMNHVNQKFKI